MNIKKLLFIWDLNNLYNLFINTLYKFAVSSMMQIKWFIVFQLR
jgi:hypothetical protein